MPEPSDRSLIVAARQGDARAFGQLYRRHRAVMLAFFLARTADAELAADLTAETFASALSGCYGYRADVPPPSWLVAIGRRVLAESRRRGVVDSRARRRLGLRRLELDAGDLDRIAALRDLLPIALASCDVEQLPESARQAVRARILDELEHPRPPRVLRPSRAIELRRGPRHRPVA